MKKTRFIPRNSQEVTRPGLPGSVYVYTDTGSGYLCAMAYKAKAVKPSWHYRFSQEENRQKMINRFFDELATHEGFKKAERDLRATFRHGYKPGDILYSSWGYDQTNIDFYQVIATTEKTITFREVCQIRTSDGPLTMTGSTRPDVNHFTKDSKEYTRSAKTSGIGEKGLIKFAEHPGSMMRYLWQWDGNPKGWSDYA